METITLNRKEQQRVMVLNRVERRELTAAQAGELMGLSVRQVRRLVAAYRRDGVGAIAHGNRGRRPPHTVSEAIRERVVALAVGPYDGANHTHLTELMAEREGLYLSRSTVRRVLLKAGIKTPRQHRPPKHRRRRERYGPGRYIAANSCPARSRSRLRPSETPPGAGFDVLPVYRDSLSAHKGSLWVVLNLKHREGNGGSEPLLRAL